MPKLARSESDTDSDDGSATKIYFSIYFRTHLAPAVDFISPMKRSLRPLFSILLLAVFAATLGCRSVVRRGFSSVEFDTHLAVKVPPPVVFNSTLLGYAAVDIGEDRAKKEIEELLEGNFASLGRLRPVRRHPEVRTKTSASSSIPVILRSPKFYRFWLEFRRALEDWYRRKRFQPEIMADLVRLVKHPLDEHTGVPSSDRRYSTCAVVGNSGILLNSNHGEAIDAHELVIRLNNARIEHFESDVGSKTSLSFVNSNILHLCARRQSCFCHPYGNNVPLLMYICQPVHFLDYTFCNSTHKAPLLVTDPRFNMLCARIVKYYSVKLFVEETGKPLEQWPSTHDGSMFHYSSGMQAVMLALGICDKVSIFGFGKSDSAKHHYHTNQKAELRLHDYEAEYRFYRDLVENPQVIPFISDKFKFPTVAIYH